MIVDLIEALYHLLWGDLFTLPVAGGIGISFMVVLLFVAGIGFTLRTRLLPVRLFRDMIGAVCEKKQAAGGLSSFQTLVISTATRVGMAGRPGLLPSCAGRAQAGQKAQALGVCSAVCGVRSDLLVRHQSGDFQLGEFCL